MTSRRGSLPYRSVWGVHKPPTEDASQVDRIGTQQLSSMSLGAGNSEKAHRISGSPANQPCWAGSTSARAPRGARGEVSGEWDLSVPLHQLTYL